MDVVDTGRFERLVRRGEGRVWTHWYTEAEAEECARHPRPSLAAALRFAVKEATYKAVGNQFSGALRWRDIEVLGNEPDWRLVLRGEVGAAAAIVGAEHFNVSTCQAAGRVMALVIVSGDCSDTESVMSNHDGTRIDWVLRECAEIPVAADDAELAAIAVAVHLEESLGLTLPPDLLDHDHLVPPGALERTVRQWSGGR